MVALAVVAAGLTQAGPAWAGPSGAGGAAAAGSSPQGPRQDQSSKVLSPDKDLPSTWKKSADRAVTVAGDGSGLHVLAADSKQAYQWRTLATLSEPGFGTDLWIGNSCVTGSGKRAVVVYAPREFTNKPVLMERGAFAAVVDLTNGKVTKLADTVTLGYFNPGCGTGETAVLTQIGDDDRSRTRLLTVDTATGTVTRKQTESVQVTSAVPVGDSIVGAAAGRLIRFDRKDHPTQLATTSGPAFELRADAEGGVNFLDRKGRTVRARRALDGRTATFAQGSTGSLGLEAGTSGRVFLTGTPESMSDVPAAVRHLKVSADAKVSSTGALAVDQAVAVSLRSHVSSPLAATGWNAPSPLQIKTEVPETAKKISFTVASGAATGAGPDRAAPGKEASPALTGTATGTTARSTTMAAAVAGDPNTTIDNDRTCSQPRNDPKQQAYQPTPNQVEWAVDMAIRGSLTGSYVRQGGWRTADGLGTVDPQGMFPLPALNGTDGGRIPAQVLLGVVAQESNMWQAEGGALPGQTSSTLASTNGFYGHPNSPATPADHWLIDWTKTDCGYGIGQQTDGMKTGGLEELPANQQKAIALDYTSNIAVAARTLSTKWNELHTDNAATTIKLNTDDPAAPENWFAALWNYNSGFNFYVPGGPTEPWGLGYLNNPSNPLYPPDRHAFLDQNTYADAAYPQKWPYEEKVLGWGAWPMDTGRAYSDDGTSNNSNTAGYSPAWWSSDSDRSTVKPNLDTFCSPLVNDCDPANPPRCEIDHLGPTCDPPHWYHATQTTWKVNCPTSCGHEYLTYKTLKTELGNGNNGSGHMCNNSVPSGALVVDNVPNDVPTMTDGCSKAAWSNKGSFSFSPFEADTQNHYEAKGDLHQIGGGFGDHFWYAHTRGYGTGVDNLYRGALSHTPEVSGVMAITGTWKLSQPIDAWTRVLVHLPDTGSQTQDAVYTVDPGAGDSQNRILNVHVQDNSWVSLGVFNFSSASGTQSVSLSNYAPDGTADEDVAWDAVAFQPLPAKPKDIVVQLGDSYASGTGAGSYDFGTVTGPYASLGSQTSPGHNWNACMRSSNSWARKASLPSSATSIGSRADNLDKTLDFHSVACSGAFSYDVEPSYVGPGVGEPGSLGRYGEVTQLDSGFLNGDTTLVTLTLGGNDADFGPTVGSCGNPTVGCPDDSTVQSKLGYATGRVQTVLESIHKKASHAKIILLGYPKLFNPNSLTCTSVMTTGAQVLINGWADDMTAKEQSAAAAAKTDGAVTFYSPDPEFEGYRMCDNPSGINDLVAGPADGVLGDFSCPGALICPSMESYHPTNTGTSRYALAFQNALAAAQY
ncbi:SGNH/GDSL hydrolase family protein [Streptomyces sp. BE230]|uniref:SGNH/GDSL hydrolase family protein n=1 Tax=Streptomyces sp. BE230 TaxID=3002526 RepID=UPI002ECFB142|nr:SGNH/GDSL hydrolase family protein [Streptomyces sp. BE230]